MKLSDPSAYFIVGKGWRVGPVTDETKHAVLTRVIRALEWGLATRKNRGSLRLPS
jgi:hypothetical protein